ncbi:MAG: chloride channel protein [Pseudomonadota bacterium]
MNKKKAGESSCRLPESRPAAAHGFLRRTIIDPLPVSRIIKDESFLLCLIAVLTGVLAGYTAVGFRCMVNVISNIAMFQNFSIASVDPRLHTNGYCIILVPAAGGLVVGLLVRFFAREAKGHGVPEVMEAVVKKHGIIRPRLVLVKALASAVCIGTGGSVGREGPIVQVGSALGSTIGQVIKIRPDLLKIVVACGAAGGISATFNTPISGVIFAFELLLFEFKTRSFIPLVIASVFGTIISRIYLGHNPAFIVPSYTLVSPLELFFYLGLGVIAAFVAIAEVKILYRVEDAFDRLRIPEWIKPVIGGLLIGVIALQFPGIMGIGYHGVGDALTEQLPVMVLLSLAAMKIIALSITIGSGGSGGVFAPTLFIGSMVGGAYGCFIHGLFPDMTASYGAYALVGMAAVFAGATRATLTAIIMLFEMTMDYDIILPLMFSCVVADLITWKLQKETIYTKKIARRGTYIPADMQVNILDVKIAADIMARDIITVTPDMTVSEYEKSIKPSGHHGFPVVSDGELIGIVSDHDITACKEIGETDFTIMNLMQDKIVTAYPSSSLQSVFKSMLNLNISHVPVVDFKNPKKLVGFITKRDILTVLDEEI